MSKIVKSNEYKLGNYVDTSLDNADIKTFNLNKISINKEREVTIFENEVEVKTQEGYLIKSDFAEYNKKKGMLTFKNNIVAIAAPYPIL